VTRKIDAHYPKLRYMALKNGVLFEGNSLHKSPLRGAGHPSTTRRRPSSPSSNSRVTTRQALLRKAGFPSPRFTIHVHGLCSRGGGELVLVNHHPALAKQHVENIRYGDVRPSEKHLSHSTPGGESDGDCLDPGRAGNVSV